MNHVQTRAPKGPGRTQRAFRYIGDVLGISTLEYSRQKNIVDVDAPKSRTGYGIRIIALGPTSLSKAYEKINDGKKFTRSSPDKGWGDKTGTCNVAISTSVHFYLDLLGEVPTKAIMISHKTDGTIDISEMKITEASGFSGSILNVELFGNLKSVEVYVQYY